MLKSRNSEKGWIILFIVIALLSGWIGLLVDTLIPDQAPGETLGLGIWLVLPFLSGIIIRSIRKDWKDFGVKPKIKGNIKWYVFAILIFPVITLVYTIIAWSLGYVTLSSFSATTLVPVFASLFLGLFIKNIFEDFAWQGFLTPKVVATKASDIKIYLIVGLVWAFWHAPYYLYFLPDSIYSTPFDRVLDVFVRSPIIITIWAVMFVEMTRITRSVWPAVLMHTLEDAIPNYLIIEERITVFTGLGDTLFSPLSGIIPLLTYLAIGLWLRKKRIERDKQLIT